MDEESELIEVERLIDMAVLRQPTEDEIENLDSIPFLTTKTVKDWRFREMKWQRRARLVARDYAWQDPNRIDVYAPAGGMSLLRLIPGVGWRLWVLDVKDAYLNYPQPKLVRVRVDYKIAEKLGVPQDWILGRVLPGQREGAAEWYKTLAKELERGGLHRCAEAPTMWGNDEKTVVLLSHVDDILLSGVEVDVVKLIESIQENFKVSIENEEKVNFLKRAIEIYKDDIHIYPNEKYIDNLIKIVSQFRSAVGTLLYISGDRPDCQFLIKELAGQLQKPTVGGWKTLEKLVGYLASTRDFHVEMKSDKKSNSFTSKVELAEVPEFVEDEGTWLLEVATDADWSGDKVTRSSTSAGVVFLGGNWIHSFSRTQRNVTLSSTESEYVALVAGASEGLLLKAVLENLTGQKVKLVLWCDNSAAVAICHREGVGKIKHLEGKLMWLQQRVGRNEIEIRRVPTKWNPADLGTKSLTGARVRLCCFCSISTILMDPWGNENLRLKPTRRNQRGCSRQ